MSSTIEISGTHEQAARLIPWLVNGTLSAEEAVRLRAHLAGCAQGAEDYETEKRLYEAIRADGPLMLTGEPSFAKLMARIEADEFAKPEPQSIDERSVPEHAQTDRADAERVDTAGVAARERRVRRGTAKRRGSRRAPLRSSTTIRWLSAAVVLQALCLGLVAWAWQGRAVGDASATAGPRAAYRTLSTPSPRVSGGAHARVVFRSDLSLERMQELLQGAGAHIVDGPTEAHVYTLGFGQSLSAAAVDARVAALRAHPEILFAEPADERSP